MDKARSPLAMAMRRFICVRGVVPGLILLSGFVLVAIYAPLIASESALLWIDKDGWSLPLLHELFNRRSYPQRHDLLFNLLIILAPLIIISVLVLRRRLGAGFLLMSSIGMVLAIWVACQLPILPSHEGWRAPWRDRPGDAHTIRVWTAAAEQGTPPKAVFPLVPHRYDAPYEGAILKAPMRVNPVTRHRFLLGTDSIGFDVLARMVFGARISLTIGLVATAIAMGIGSILGAVSGYFGGWTDLVLQRLVEIMMCFPTFILVLVVISMFDRNIFLIMGVIGLTGWAGTARLVRGEFLSQSVRDYVLAAEALGLSRTRIMFRHILPNSMSPLLITATFMIAGSIFTESGLAFLGLGDPIAPSWGQMLNQGRENLHYAWLIYVPGLAVFLLLTSLNLIGNGLREALDPKSTS
ncbi:MAG: ABC transporter permease [Planctomycetes bacterium]|nr:ABC transporter permease [Planctomycetota bacterium]